MMADPAKQEKEPVSNESVSKEREEDLGDEASDSDDEDSVAASRGKRGRSQDEDDKTDSLSKLRREKRLAMNRESARARRKRKKMLIETLEQQVSELTRSNEKFKIENSQLVGRVENLSERLAKQDKELVLLRSIVGKTQGPHFAASQSQAHESMASGTVSAGMHGSVGMSMPPNFALDASDPTSDVSLRRLLHSQNLSSLGAGASGFQFGVPPNRGIDQQILSRIGTDHPVHMYDQISHSPHRAHAAVTGAALPGRNTVGPIWQVSSTVVSSTISQLLRFAHHVHSRVCLPRSRSSPLPDHKD
uniref:BZIP domain-containing protein n=1 Tax=Amphora coffeiformis TaxID=265554 RepID=A0A7S3P978_9STRA